MAVALSCESSDEARLTERESLAAWVARNGSLWPPAAVVIVLNACAQASRLPDRRLRQAIGSLNPDGIARRGGDGWVWQPTGVGGSAGRVTDADVIERLGAILFHSLTGERPGDRFAGEQTVRTRLKTLRPELPPAVTDLTVQAITCRRLAGPSLSGFAHQARQVLGIEQSRESSRRARRLIGITALALAVLAALWSTAWLGGRQRVESHGLTADDTTLVDVLVEAAELFALMGEHTAAIQVSQLWRANILPDDPRLAWNAAHDAWVRTLAGDRFTTEQGLTDLPGWFSRELGEHHPYTRATRLGLAAALEGRGATVEAAESRRGADLVFEQLAAGARLRQSIAPELPTPPGVVAHVAPNVAEREGFRRDVSGGFHFPLTSVQREMAERGGWRLHLVAGSPCQAAVVIGAVPRRIRLLVARTTDSRWQLQVEGTSPPAVLTANAGDVFAASLIANGTPSILVRLDHETRVLAVDESGPTPSPPYSLAFDDRTAPGSCAVVWLEIPFPSRPKPAAP